MQIQESREGGKQQENPVEWLNLSLGRNQESQSQSRAASIKVYSCNFCRRKFYSSQALGGHQNAHKRERGAARHYMMDLPSMARSLGVQAHSHIQKPGRDGPAAVSRFIEPNTGVGSSWQAQEAADLLWPGCFRFDPKQLEQKSSNSDMLDLNLKL